MDRNMAGTCGSNRSCLLLVDNPCDVCSRFESVVECVSALVRPALLAWRGVKAGGAGSVPLPGEKDRLSGLCPEVPAERLNRANGFGVSVSLQG